MISIQVLKEFELFEGLTDSELTKITDLCHERTLDEGNQSFIQGRKANEIHLCRSGRVEIVVQTYKPFNVKVKVHTAKAGEVFGWSALVKPYIYTASAECVEKVEEVYIKGSELMDLFEQNDHTGYVIMRNLSGHVSSRLTESREKLIKEIASAYNLEW